MPASTSGSSAAAEAPKRPGRTRTNASASCRWPSRAARARGSCARFGRTAAERDAFLDGVRPDELPRNITYRDSLGGLFVASLGEMLVQACIHSTHHRAQAVNILRRLSAAPPEWDYMMHVRRPA